MTKILLSCITFVMFAADASAHQGHVHAHAQQACVDLKRSQQCEYSPNGKQVYKGTCQLLSQQMMCVRNQPIVDITELSTRKKDTKLGAVENN